MVHPPLLLIFLDPQAAEDARQALGNIEKMTNLQLQAQEALRRAVQDQVRAGEHSWMALQELMRGTEQLAESMQLLVLMMQLHLGKGIQMLSLC